MSHCRSTISDMRKYQVKPTILFGKSGILLSSFLPFAYFWRASSKLYFSLQKDTERADLEMNLEDQMNEIGNGFRRIIGSKCKDNELVIKEILKLQVDGKGFDINFKFEDGKTLLQWAIEKQEYGIAELIMENGATADNGDGTSDGTLNELIKSRKLTDQPLRECGGVSQGTLDVKQKFYAAKYVVKCPLDEVNNILESRKKDRMFKILEIISTESNLQFLSNSDFCEKFNATSHTFVICLNLISMPTDKMHRIACGINRPLIVQVCVRDKILIYYKESGDQTLHLIDDDETPLTEAEILELDGENKFDFKMLLRVIRTGTAGFHDGNLLSINFDIFESWNNIRMIDHATICNDVLSLRFIMLNDWKLPFRKNALEIAAAFGNCDSFFALLDLAIEAAFGERVITAANNDLLHQLSAGGETLLMIAARLNTPLVIDFLIRAGININYCNNQTGNSAFDEAWIARKDENLLTIVKADGKNFKKFKDEDFKIAISKESAIGKRKKLDKFLVANDFLKKDSQWRQDKQRHYTKFLRENMTKTFLKPDSSILFLLRRTRFKSDNTAEHFRVVENFYKILNDIPEISTVLRYISHCKSLHIIFDFSDESTAKSSPTTTCATKASCVFEFGRIYVGAKSLASDTRSLTKVHNVMGHFAHEATHLAVHMLYQNESNPFRKSDFERKANFGKIISSLYRNYLQLRVDGRFFDMEELIRLVFEKYPPRDWSRELIVRVPHLITFYHKSAGGDAKLQEIRTEYKELFDFFDENVRQPMLAFLENSNGYESTTEVASLNKMIGKLQPILDGNIKLVNVLEDFMWNRHRTVVYKSNIPQLIIHNIVQTLQTVETQLEGSWILVAADQLDNFIEKIIEGQVHYHATIIVDCSAITNGQLDFIGRLAGNNLILVFKNNEQLLPECMSKFQSEFQFNLHSVDVEFSWEKISAESKTKLLETVVTFQNVAVKLSNIIGRIVLMSTPFPYDLFLSNLVNGIKIVIDSELKAIEDKDEIYIKRIYLPRSEDGDDKMSEVTGGYFRETFMSRRAYLIYNEPGMGKTTELEMLKVDVKKLFPFYWIMHINLKDHYKDFKKILTILDKKEENVEDSQFILSIFDERKEIVEEASQSFFTYPKKRENIVKFFQKFILKDSNYDREIFKFLFNSHRVAILMDGFDEICPSFKQIVLTLIKVILEETGNHILISTRPHFTKELKQQAKNVPFEVFHLKGLSKENIDEMFKFFFKNYSDHEIKSKINALERIKIPLSNPLMLRMLCEVLHDDSISNLSSLNVYSLFTEFVDKKIIRTMSKGPEAGKSLSNQVGNSEITEFYQFHALSTIYFQELGEKKIWRIFSKSAISAVKVDDVTRVGLMYSDDSEGKSYYFTHRSYGEYFLAKFLYEMIFRQISSEERIGIIVEIFINILCNSDDYEMVLRFLNGALETHSFETDSIESTQFKKIFNEIVGRDYRLTMKLWRGVSHRINWRDVNGIDKSDSHHYWEFITRFNRDIRQTLDKIREVCKKLIFHGWHCLFKAFAIFFISSDYYQNWFRASDHREGSLLRFKGTYKGNDIELVIHENNRLMELVKENLASSENLRKIFSACRDICGNFEYQILLQTNSCIAAGNERYFYFKMLGIFLIKLREHLSVTEFKQFLTNRVFKWEWRMPVSHGSKLERVEKCFLWNVWKNSRLLTFFIDFIEKTFAIDELKKFLQFPIEISDASHELSESHLMFVAKASYWFRIISAFSNSSEWSDKFPESILMHAAQHADGDNFEYLWNLYERNFSPEEQEIFLEEANANGEMLLNYATYNKDVTTFKFLLKLYRKTLKFDNENFKNIFRNESWLFSWTSFQNRCAYRHTIHEIWLFLQDIFSGDEKTLQQLLTRESTELPKISLLSVFKENLIEVQDVFSDKNPSEELLIQESKQLPKISLVYILKENNLTEATIGSMEWFASKDPFLCCVYRGNDIELVIGRYNTLRKLVVQNLSSTEMLEEIFALCKEKCGDFKYGILLKANSYIAAATDYNLDFDFKTFEVFMIKLRAHLPKFEFEQFLRNRDVHGEWRIPYWPGSVFYKVWENSQLLNFFINLIKETFEIDKLKDFLKSLFEPLKVSDQFSKSILMHMAEHANGIDFEILWNLYDGTFLPEEQKTLLEGNADRSILLNYATRNRDATTFKFLLKLYRKFFNENELKGLFFTPTWLFSWTRFQSKDRNRELMREVWFFLQDIFSGDEKTLEQLLTRESTRNPKISLLSVLRENSLAKEFLTSEEEIQSDSRS